jgi:hypothetical protein
MENQNDKDQSEDGQKDKEKIHEYIEQMAQSKKTPVAKDLVELKHVEVKKQEIGQDTIDLAKSLKDQYIQHDQFERLSNDEMTILEAFMGKRMFLTRIAIVVNQSRVLLGIEPFKKAELEKIIDNLISKGYIESQKVGDNIVYYLTERGNYRVQ